jgi:tetratricopeptide (TPR) repeat protein
MPSHIFVRLGLWDDCIKSNTQSVSAARCYAESAGIKAHWDEELHGLDYLVYAYLQKGDNASAREQLKYINDMDSVYPLNFKCAYTFAAVPSRVALENKNWEEAANVQLHRNFPWKKFPWQESIIHFTRLLGNAHFGNIEAAKVELAKLNELHDTLAKLTDINRTKAVAIQIKAGEAWIEFANGNKAKALNYMRLAADMEDSTSKHPVTPGEVRPARELYADMLLQLKQNDKALQAYETVLQNNPNRFNSLYGAAVASQRMNDMKKAGSYYQQLVAIANLRSERSELLDAMDFLKRH